MLYSRLSRAFLLFAILSLAISRGAVGQTVTLGNLGESNYFPFGTIHRTVLELNHPAQAAGQVSVATFTWSAAPCPAAVTLKFFRPIGQYQVLFEQRGPFDVLTKTQTVLLSPPVSVQPRDKIAITNNTSCGGPTGHSPGSGPAGFMTFADETSIIVPLTPPEAVDVLVYASSTNYLSLLSGRFRVELLATNPRTGIVAAGQPLQQTDRSGSFSLPGFTGDATFPEVTVKMLDATGAPPPFGGSFWFFYSTLTDTTIHLTVVDTISGNIKRYDCSPTDPSHLCSAADTSAFGP